MTPVIIFAAVMLFIAATFNLITWPRFFIRVKNDPRALDDQGKRTTFYRVHLILFIIAELIALAALFGGVALLTL